MDYFLRNIIDFTGREPALNLVSQSWNEALQLNRQEILEGAYRQYPIHPVTGGSNTTIEHLIYSVASDNNIGLLHNIISQVITNINSINWREALPLPMTEDVFYLLSDDILNRLVTPTQLDVINQISVDQGSLLQLEDNDDLRYILTDSPDDWTNNWNITIGDRRSLLILMFGAINFYNRYLRGQYDESLVFAIASIRDILLQDKETLRYALLGAIEYYKDIPESYSMLQFIAGQNIYKDLQAQALSYAINNKLYDIVRMHLNYDNFIRSIIHTGYIKNDYTVVTYDREFYEILRQKDLYPEWLGFYSDDKELLSNMSIIPIQPPYDYWSRLLATAIATDGYDIFIAKILDKHREEITPDMLDRLRQLAISNSTNLGMFSRIFASYHLNL